MKWPDNKVGTMIRHFKESLAKGYESREIDQLIRLCFSHHLSYSTKDLILKKDNRLSESEILLFNDTVNQLQAGRPVQYVLGETEFMGLTFKVDESVLIPRPETEELVQLVESYCLEHKKKLKILDIGTGSGCIAVALQKRVPHAEVSAIDISEEALHLARENAAQNDVSINFLAEDILNPKPEFFDHSWDVIVSNPPYVLDREKAMMSERVTEHEPHIALFVKNDDGLLFYRVIQEYAKKCLNSGGLLAFEINENKGNDVFKIIDNQYFRYGQLVKDLSSRNRILKAVMR